MVLIAPIKLQYNPKTLWFDANGLEIHKDDPVVVTTARGIEFGHAVGEVFEADDKEIANLKTELKPVERIASEEDEEKACQMQKRSDEAFPIFKEMALEVSDQMHPVSVEFLLDGDKAVFYFEAEERVDFRELVRKLAAKFHVRIDMRQIGVRDEARMVGGIGHCGQELCCKRMGGDFNPVSIRMAKEQDLSLNPQKISGVCGRLMCCLRYEYDAYKEFKSRAPKINAKIETPEGVAKVIDLNVPKEIITLLLEDDKQVKIPLDEMEKPEEGARPTKVSKQAFERFANQDIFATFDAISFPNLQDSPLFEKDETEQKNKKSSRKGGNKNQNEEKARKPRRRIKMNKDGSAETEQVEGKKQKPQDSESGKKRSGQKRRSRKSTGSSQSREKTNEQSPQKKSSDSKQGQSPRPGQRSSGLRKGNGNGQKKAAAPKASSANKPQGEGKQEHRRVRRRSHKADAGGAE